LITVPSTCSRPRTSSSGLRAMSSAWRSKRPGTAKGFVFLTLEDETGMVNVVVRPDRFERQALLIARSPLLLVRGRLQVEGTVINVRAEEFEVLTAPVGAEHAQRHDFH